MLQIKINKDGYVEEFMLPGSISELQGGIKLEEFDIDLEDFKDNFNAYMFNGEKLFRNNNILSSVISERENEELRYLREKECFKYINRGEFWYATLSSSQKEELMNWYTEWLNVTETKNIPTKPNWLK